MIACISVPHFAAAIHQREKVSLRDGPLIITDGLKVLACCQYASQEGVRPDMSHSQAGAICPAAQIVYATPSRYQADFAEILEKLSTFAPSIEAVNGWREGEDGSALFFLDLGQLRPLETKRMSQRLVKAMTEDVGLKGRFGIAEGKFTAYVAASYASLGEAIVVQPGEAADFLQPLPITLLPLDSELASLFLLLGLKTLGHLAALPSKAIFARFGKAGRFLQHLAHGRDSRPLVPHKLKQQQRAERHLDEPVANWQIADMLLKSLAEELSEGLREVDLLTQELSLFTRLETGRAREETIQLREPAASVPYLLERLKGLARKTDVNSGLVEVAAIVANLTPAMGRQLELFPSPTSQAGEIESLINDLVRRFGTECFYRIEANRQKSPLFEQRYRLMRADAA